MEGLEMLELRNIFLRAERKTLIIMQYARQA